MLKGLVFNARIAKPRRPWSCLSINLKWQEKVSHENTEALVRLLRSDVTDIADTESYIAQILDTSMTFPAFSNYQDTLLSPLKPPMFAAFSLPS